MDVADAVDAATAALEDAAVDVADAAVDAATDVSEDAVDAAVDAATDVSEDAVVDAAVTTVAEEDVSLAKKCASKES